MGPCFSAPTKDDDGPISTKGGSTESRRVSPTPTKTTATVLQPASSDQHGTQPQLQQQQPPQQQRKQRHRQPAHQDRQEQPHTLEQVGSSSEQHSEQQRQHQEQQQLPQPSPSQDTATPQQLQQRLPSQLCTPQTASQSPAYAAVRFAGAHSDTAASDVSSDQGATSSSGSSYIAAVGADAHSRQLSSGGRQVELLRSQKSQRLRDRRSVTNSFKSLQLAVSSDEAPLAAVHTRAAGLKHIGFGPFKRENQDEFFIQIGSFGGIDGANLFCVFDGHGTYGKDAAAYSRQKLPMLLDAEMRKYFQKVSNPEEGLKGAVEVLLSEVFGETERSLTKAGINISSSGTTASVAYQYGNRVWVASAGDSRVIMCCKDKDEGAWHLQALTIDHRPRRPSERARVEASGGRVAPKRLPSGRTVGEPRLWLADIPSPGLLLSRSLGDLTAATVGCTSDPEITYLTLRSDVDCYMVLASDGVWDVLTNDQVCEIVAASPDPHIACRRVLDAALFEWEERMSADNITVVVTEFLWNADGTGADESAEFARVAAENGMGSSPKLANGGGEDEEDADAVEPLPPLRLKRQLRHPRAAAAVGAPAAVAAAVAGAAHSAG